MIEREIIAQKAKEHYIKKFVEERLPKVGISSIKLKKIPLGEKIIINTSRPSLVVGSKGANIKDLTKTLKKKFNLENPQIEINEVKAVYLDAQIVAERIATSLERFGSARFKGIAHKVMENVISSGALGIELVVSGKIPGARAKSWRFYQGYLKKCGDVSIVGVRKAHTTALLKTGVIGIKVAIMPPDLELPDTIEILAEAQSVVDQQAVDEKAAKKKGKKKAAAGKRKAKKADKQKDDSGDIASEASEEASSEEAPGHPTEDSTGAEQPKKAAPAQDVSEDSAEEREDTVSSSEEKEDVENTEKDRS